jgi:hypothetical protein
MNHTRNMHHQLIAFRRFATERKSAVLIFLDRLICGAFCPALPSDEILQW